MRRSMTDYITDNFTYGERLQLLSLRKRNRTHKSPSKYKIIITADRCDYDDLSELAEYPEKGNKVGTFYFTYPDQLQLILKAFEGLFYQLFEVDSTECKGSGVFDDYVFEDWWNDDCPVVCDFCFLRKNSVEVPGKEYNYWTCRRGDSDEEMKEIINKKD